MGKLYPPIIHGTIPAFTGTTLVVPFSLNKAVSRSEIYGIAIKTKTVSGVIKETLSAYAFDILNNYTATFKLSEDKYEVGQFYKIQIAFIDKEGTVGHYSSIGVTKRTTAPVVSIEKMSFGIINSHNYYYTGVYSQQDRDTTEKLYSSRFKLYDENGNIIKDTGDILHSSMNDTLPYEATESFKFEQDLEINKSFYIQFCTTSVNGIEANSPKYRVIQKRSVNPEIQTKLVADLNEDNGFVTLTFDTDLDVILGTFLISRASSKNGWVYEEFRRFNLQSIIPESWSMLDCTIEHGVSYKYSLQQYNENGIYSERIESNMVTATFSDSFIYDGERQLCIKFNPKVSSFKNDLAEQKTDTIGSKHPFIIRNGNLKYKEFSIGGLISYIMDESEQLFMTLDDLGMAHIETDLTHENILAERTFKLSVLDWLTDGKAKLFRSPAEGNYIVRLLNVSMTPQDALGRMLHSFTATAYEIADFTMENLEKYKLIDPSENLKEQTRWASVYLPDFLQAYKVTDAPEKIPLNGMRYAYSIKFTDMLPGAIVYLDDEAIMIGGTGSYEAHVSNPVKKIFVDSRFIGQGMLTYSYKTKAISVFGTVMDIDIKDYPARQFIGKAYQTKEFNPNLLDYIKDVRTEVLKIAMARFEARHVIEVYDDIVLKDDEVYTPDIERPLYLDMDCTIPIQLSELDDLYMYRIRLRRSDYKGYVLKKHAGTSNASQKLYIFKGEGIYIDANNSTFAPYTDYCVDGYSKKILPFNDDLFKLEVDGEFISLKETERFTIGIPNEVKRIVPGEGLISELGYSTQIITYTFDTQDEATYNARASYLTALALYESYRVDVSRDPEEIAQAKKDMENAYVLYINALSQAIKAYKEAYGVS